MRLIRQYISSTVFKSSLVVLLAVSSLYLIITLLDQTGDIKNNYTFPEVLRYTLYIAPSRLVDSIPFAVLIGVLFGLGQLAGGSELAVMRAAGISVYRLGWYAMRGALVLIIIGMLIEEFVAPALEQTAEAERTVMRANPDSRPVVNESKTSLWSREGDEFFHINSVLPSGKLYGLTRFDFKDGKLQRVSFTKQGIYQNDHWLLEDTLVSEYGKLKVDTYDVASEQWVADMSPRIMQIVSADEASLSVRDLYYYKNYLASQHQDASRYSLTFWQKISSPLASLSLVFIAISFIFGPLRETTMGFRVFVGVVVGIAFSTLQNVLGPICLVYGLSPLFAAITPIVLCIWAGIMLLRRAN